MEVGASLPLSNVSMLHLTGALVLAGEGGPAGSITFTSKSCIPVVPNTVVNEVMEGSSFELMCTPSRVCCTIYLAPVGLGSSAVRYSLGIFQLSTAMSSDVLNCKEHSRSRGGLEKPAGVCTCQLCT